MDPNSTSLQVPEFQRNLLISPPGSPCEGWEQIEEDAPNRAILASDLMQAAEVSDYELDEDEYSLERPNLPEKTPALGLPSNVRKERNNLTIYLRLQYKIGMGISW